MTQETVRHIIQAAAYTGLALDVATLVVVVPAWTGHPSTSGLITVLATGIMIATLAVQLAFVLMQTTPNGRAMVAVPGLGHDGWFFVVASTLLPGVLWSNLAAAAAPFMRLIMPGFTTPAVVALLLLVGRGVQQRRMRTIRGASM